LNKEHQIQFIRRYIDIAIMSEGALDYSTDNSFMSWQGGWMIWGKLEFSRPGFAGSVPRAIGK
jgi:hypothetical protein